MTLKKKWKFNFPKYGVIIGASAKSNKINI